MSRVKRGVTARARHKKVLAMPRGIAVVPKTFSALPLKKLKKVYSTLTATVKPRKEVSALCGFKESMQLLVCMI